MKELFTLGELYPSDFLAEGEQPRSGKVEMKMMMDKEGYVRLEKTADSDKMYGKYWYRSGINNTMKTELKDIVDSITKIYKLKYNDLWLDIACNDGTLLSYVPNYLYRVGVDPADDSFKAESQKHADLIIQNYFTATEFKSHFEGQKAKVITSIAMFYDLENPGAFIKDVYDVLHDDGLWVMQLSYTPLMLQQLAFDNICHEHIYYYSLDNLQQLLGNHGFKIMDCQLNDINGGSFRVYIMKYRANTNLFSSQPYRDVCEMRVNSLLKYEQATYSGYGSAWLKFFANITQLKEQTVNFIKEEKAKGKTIWGYGASTKGNTLLQYFGLDNTLITGIAERSTAKYGLRTVGTNIPIYSEEEMRNANPHYLLILPWHFIEEFKTRESEYLSKGGKMIVPCPKFEVYST